MVGINLTILSQTKYDNARKEYGSIIKDSVIPNYSTAACDEVWNIFSNKRLQAIGVKKTRETKRFLTEEENKRIEKSVRKQNNFQSILI